MPNEEVREMVTYEETENDTTMVPTEDCVTEDCVEVSEASIGPSMVRALLTIGVTTAGALLTVKVGKAVARKGGKMVKQARDYIKGKRIAAAKRTLEDVGYTVSVDSVYSEHTESEKTEEEEK